MTSCGCTRPMQAPALQWRCAATTCALWKAAKRRVEALRVWARCCGDWSALTGARCCGTETGSAAWQHGSVQRAPCNAYHAACNMHAHHATDKVQRAALQCVV